jgi:two-component system, LytTR family, response regulator
MNKPAIKALIIDDEALSADMLGYLIEKNIPAITQLKRTTSAIEGLKLIESFQPDIVFLDIQMPFLSGFELLAKLPKHPFSVIFTTAYNKYAIKAIRFSALDYLLKPVDTDELIMAVERYLQKFSEKKYLQDLYLNFMDNLQASGEKQYRLALHTHLGLKLVTPKEIVRCQANNNYTIFYLADGSTITTSKTIKEYEEILGEHQFIRVHKSHLVSLLFIDLITPKNQLKLLDKTLVDISRRRKPELMEILKNKPPHL